MRRANIGDEQVCVDALTLSRRPLPLDTDKPPTFDSTEIDKHAKKFNTNAEKRGDSPYDNVFTAVDDLKPQYGSLVQPSSAQSSSIHHSHTEAIPTATQLSNPFVSAFKQPATVTGQVVKSPHSNVGTILQSRSPEAPPPVYAAAKDMPSAQPRNISYGRDDEVDALAALLKNVDPHVMENEMHRQQIMSQLESYSSTGSGSGKTELPPKIPSRHVHTSPTVPVRTGWQCRQCTFYNENSEHQCEMCNSEKD